MPWLKVQDRRNEVETVCRLSLVSALFDLHGEVAHQERHGQIKERLVLEQALDIFPARLGMRDRLIHCPSGAVQQDALTAGEEDDAETQGDDQLPRRSA